MPTKVCVLKTCSVGDAGAIGAMRKVQAEEGDERSRVHYVPLDLGAWAGGGCDKDVCQENRSRYALLTRFSFQ
jgi:hypothetical protein